MNRLIDSNLWIEWLRPGSPAGLLQIRREIEADTAVICEPVRLEVIGFAHSQLRRKTMRALAICPCLEAPASLWDEAIDLCAEARDSGMTPGHLDLLILVMARHHQATVVTFDAGMAELAALAKVKVDLLRREG